MPRYDVAPGQLTLAGLDRVNQESDMGVKHVTNDGPNTIYVGGKMIAPGEGRDIDERLLPPELRDAVAPGSGEDQLFDPDEALRALLSGTVTVVKAALPGMSEDTLKRLQELENEAEKPRKGVLEALADALIAIADAKLTNSDLDADVQVPKA